MQSGDSDGNVYKKIIIQEIFSILQIKINLSEFLGLYGFKKRILVIQLFSFKNNLNVYLFN